jgi:hypothetical protein
VKDPQALVPTLSGYARFLLEHGRPDEAVALLEEMNELSEYFGASIDLGWVLHDLGRPDLMRSEARGGVWADSGALIAGGEIAAAADLLGEKGLHTEEAYARLRVAETLAGAERAAQLEPAVAFYRSVGAGWYVRRAEALLAASA